MTKKSKSAQISTGVLEKAAECLRTLAHPVRLRMIECMLNTRYTVGELADICDIRPNMASEHLRLMELCGLLVKEREGRKIFYRCGHPCLEQILECIRHRFG